MANCCRVNIEHVNYTNVIYALCLADALRKVDVLGRSALGLSGRARRESRAKLRTGQVTELALDESGTFKTGLTATQIG